MYPRTVRLFALNMKLREGNEIMAIVLVEEVLMGLDEVKLSLDQAVALLEDMTEDLHPDVGDNLKESLETALLRPLQSRVTVIETLLDDLAATV